MNTVEIADLQFRAEALLKRAQRLQGVCEVSPGFAANLARDFVALFTSVTVDEMPYNEVLTWLVHYEAEIELDRRGQLQGVAIDAAWFASLDRPMKFNQ